MCACMYTLIYICLYMYGAFEPDPPFWDAPCGPWPKVRKQSSKLNLSGVGKQISAGEQRTWGSGIVGIWAWNVKTIGIMPCIFWRLGETMVWVGWHGFGSQMAFWPSSQSLDTSLQGSSGRLGVEDLVQWQTATWGGITEKHQLTNSPDGSGVYLCVFDSITLIWKTKAFWWLRGLYID